VADKPKETAQERGARLRREAVQRGEERRRPAIERGERNRAPAIQRGENIRFAPQFRGELRRAAHTNKFSLTPPPASGKQAEQARAMQEAQPIQRILKKVDKARGKQN